MRESARGPMTCLYKKVIKYCCLIVRGIEALLCTYLAITMIV